MAEENEEDKNWIESRKNERSSGSDESSGIISKGVSGFSYIIFSKALFDHGFPNN